MRGPLPLPPLARRVRARAATAFLVAALVGGGVWGGGVLGGCAHLPDATPDKTAERRLLVLEREFLGFTSRRLDRTPEGGGREGEEAVAAVEEEVAELERLRLLYL